MRKYYKIFRIDMLCVEVNTDNTGMCESYFTSEKCLVQDGGAKYETEEEAEKMLGDYFENFPERAKNEEYVILKCYKMEE